MSGTRHLRFTAIEAARGVAALLVVIHHAGNMVMEPRFYGALPFAGHLANFNVGVDFFFVLSGFIIAWVHWGDLGQHERIGNYARKRFLRVFPPYWGILFPLILFYLFAPGAGGPAQHDPLSILLSIVLLPNVTQPVLGVAWTLTHELFFYILFALAIAGGRRVLALFVLWAVAIVAANIGGPPSFPLSFILSPFNLEFIMGVGAAALLRHARIPAPAYVLAAGTAGFLLLMLVALHAQDDPLRGRILFGAASTLFVLGAVELERRRSLRIPRPLLFLGAASYTIYLAHTPVLAFTVPLISRVLRGSLSAEAFTLLIAIVATIGGIAYHLLAEKRLTRIAGHLLDRASRFALPPRPSLEPKP